MATPADQRLLELLEKWLKSLELHAKYSSLDDGSYWQIQPWVEHQRPSRWIIDLAVQKILSLRGHVQERIKMGDAKFSDALELMTFLANLVGSEHIERFIPMAEVQNERPLERRLPSADAHPPVEDTQPAPQAAHPAAVSASPPAQTTRPPADAATGTREMPQFAGPRRTPPPAGTAQVARTERKAAVPVKPAAKPASKQLKPGGKIAAKGGASAEREGPSDAQRAQVIADAARLVQWGRKWFELPELIARMADRPALPAVRRILKENKLDIDAKVKGA